MILSRYRNYRSENSRFGIYDVVQAVRPYFQPFSSIKLNQTHLVKWRRSKTVLYEKGACKWNFSKVETSCSFTHKWKGILLSFCMIISQVVFLQGASSYHIYKADLSKVIPIPVFAWFHHELLFNQNKNLHTSWRDYTQIHFCDNIPKLIG